MNGPVKMYRTRQIVQNDLKVSLPNCMYKLKNIHATSDETGPLGDHVSPTKKSVDISEQVKQFLKNLQDRPEMTALIERQQKILKQLDELRQQMITLKSDLSTTNGPVNAKAYETTFVCPSKISKMPNMTINANPTHPPYSLLLIQKLSSFHLCVTIYCHSTVSSLPKQAEAFARALESHQSQPHQSAVNVMLIWKDVGPDPELIISQMPIMGEVNILRYFARMNPDNLPYETLANVPEIDSTLDICYCLARSKTKVDRSNLLHLLNKKLGKSDWFCGHSKITIADIAASSAVKQVALNEINQNMAKWLEKCEAIAA